MYFVKEKKIFGSIFLLFLFKVEINQAFLNRYSPWQNTMKSGFNLSTIVNNCLAQLVLGCEAA
jgi:hypothetical protein